MLRQTETKPTEQTEMSLLDAILLETESQAKAKPLSDRLPILSEMLSESPKVPPAIEPAGSEQAAGVLNEMEQALTARRAESAPTRKVGETRSRSAVKVGDFVFYTSKRGTTKRYRVVRLGRNGSVQLEMLGHSRRDALKGKRFWAQASRIKRDAASQTDNGRRICSVCGQIGCNIGPFVRV